MKKIIIALSIMMCGAHAMAATIAEGTKEILLSGSINADTALGTDINLNLGLGYAVIDNVVVGGIFGFYDNDANTFFDLGVYGEYNVAITDSAWMPYVGAQVAWGKSDPDGALDGVDAVVARPYAGLKYFFNSSVAAFAEFGWSFASDDLYINEDFEAVSDSYGILLGLRVYIP
jgi:hypothetical protein